MASSVRASQLLVVMLVVAAIPLSIAAAFPIEGNRRSLLYDEASQNTDEKETPTAYTPPPRYLSPPPPRIASCNHNATLCLDPAMHPAGPTCCVTKCVDTTVDAWNCGGCSRACSTGWTCCKSKCVNLVTDAYNCGQCGSKCPKNWSGTPSPCTMGFCGYNGWGI